MYWLEHPSRDLWKERQQWFERLIGLYEEKGSYIVSEQACALIGEVQTVFCAGAWVAVIVLSLAVVDAQLRETEYPEFNGNTKRLLEILETNPDLQDLRLRRNSIIHVDNKKPGITVDQQWSSRNDLETEARKAIELMLEAFYGNPGT